MLHSQRLTKRVVAAAAGILTPVAVQRPHLTACRPRHACISRVSSSTPGSITDDEAERFEKIAAALVEKLKDIPDTELEPEDAFADDDLLVEFGSVASPQQAADIQARLEERRAAAAAASSSTLSSSSTSSSRSSSSFVPRKLRRKQLPIEALPKVAIVGRPNVGKSAMFNRLAGSSLAVVFDYPGVTRDRLYTRAFWGDKEFCLIDTGGLMSDATKLPAEQQAAAMASISAEGLPQAIERQAAAGVAEADSVVLVVDGQSGLHPSDEEVLSWLRQHHPGKPVVLAVNKCESTTQGPTQAAEFWELGLEPFPVSAISGTGTGEMLDKLVGTLPPPKDMESIDEKDKPLAIAIVGRPNVGKSSLLNAVCGEERAIVCDLSGTTRDAVDTTVTLPGGQQLTLIDTAGIRKRARVADSKDGAEQLSVDRAMRAVSRAEVVAIVLDGSEGVTQQDFRLSELVAKDGAAAVVVVNKWDRVAPKAAEDMDAYKADVKAQLRPVGWAPIVCTTASKGRSVDQVVAAILAVGEQHKRRVSTATLNLVLREAVAWKAPPSQRGSLKQGRIYYATQAAVSPPTFVLFVNDPRLFSDDYRRYIERNVRQNMGFEGSPIRFWYRARRTAEREREPAAAAASSSAGGRSSSGGRGGGRGGRGGRSGSRGGKQR